jgi:NitT/TauT family transport system substrate-binding protein
MPGQKSRTIGVLLTAILMIAAYSPGSPWTRTADAAPANTKVTWVMGGDGMQVMLLHIANRGGLMAEEGVDLDLVNPNSGPRAVAAIMGGSAEVGSVGFSQVLGARAKGGKMVAVAMLLSTVDLQLVLSDEAARKAGIAADMGIDEKVKRLNGMTIAITTPGSGTDLYLRSLLVARHIDPDKSLHIQPTGGGSAMLAALQKHLVDGFVWGAPESFVAVEKGIGISAVNPLRGEVPELKNVPFLTVVTSEDTLASKPEVVRSVVRGLTRAIKFLHDHPNEARKLVRERFPDVDEQLFEAMWQQYRHVMPTTPLIEQKDFQNAVNWLNIAAPKRTEVSYAEVIKPDIAREAAKDILR